MFLSFCAKVLHQFHKAVYVNQSEIAKDFELIENKVFCFVLISAFLLAYFCLCAVYLSGLIVH